MARRVAWNTGALPSWKRWITAAASASSLSSAIAREMRPTRSASAAVRLLPPRSMLVVRFRPTSAGQQHGGHRVEDPGLDLGMAELGRSGPQARCRSQRRECCPRPGPGLPRRRRVGLSSLARFSKMRRKPSSITYARSPRWSLTSNPAEKYFPAAREHDELHLPLVLEGLEGRVQLLHHLDREDVGGRAVQGDPGDRPARRRPAELIAPLSPAPGRRCRNREDPRSRSFASSPLAPRPSAPRAHGILSKAAARPMPPLMQRLASPSRRRGGPSRAGA